MRKILITGANRGIGLEVSRQLLQAGCFVFLGCRNPERGQEAMEQLQREGWDQLHLVALDVANENSVKKAAQEIAQKTASLDGLVNNAGILGPVPQSALSTQVDSIKMVFETNFFGTIRTTQAFIHLLLKSSAPRIVNVTSDMGSLSFHSDPNWKHYHLKGAAYGPSKTAINAYTISLAYELRDTAFKVNAINPGYTATDFNQHRGTKNVIEAARVIAAYTLLDEDGPTGKFLGDEGEIPW